MRGKTYLTRCGEIHYWVSETFDLEKDTLVFLPGLTADHRLFEKQVEYFEDKYNIFVWDAPGHNESRPFDLSFTLMDKAVWLDEILIAEGISSPVLVGQSMGGYVSQAFIERFPGKAKAFISIDSAPLKLEYMKKWELLTMKKVEPIYRMYPWKRLLKDGTNGTAESEYGRKIMREMMETYSDNPKEYSRLAGHGYKILAEAIEANLPYEIDCPALLICGEKDKAGETKKFNRAWTEKSGIPLEWIPGAGHNSNTDNPDLVNTLIENLVTGLA